MKLVLTTEPVVRPSPQLLRLPFAVVCTSTAGKSISQHLDPTARLLANDLEDADGSRPYKYLGDSRASAALGPGGKKFPTTQMPFNGVAFIAWNPLDRVDRGHLFIADKNPTRRLLRART
jgi:hypothetical protein